MAGSSRAFRQMEDHLRTAPALVGGRHVGPDPARRPGRRRPRGRIDWGMVSVDSTSCRAHQHAAGARKKKPRVPKKGQRPAPPPDEGLGRSRGGLTCKIHLAGEGGCRPMAFLLTPGQWGDAPQMIEVLKRIRVPRPQGGHPRTRPDHLGGDKAYSSRRNRRYLRRRRIKHTIPKRRTSGPTASAEAARAADLPASTASTTGGATRLSGPSTDSRTPARSPPVTTRGPTSSTARSPRRQSAYGSSMIRRTVPSRRCRTAPK